MRGESRGAPGSRGARGATSTAQLVVPVRTVRVAVTPHAGGQQQALMAGLAEEIIRGRDLLDLLSLDHSKEAESEEGGEEGGRSAHPVC